jgi:DNA-binding MarR family transcriptional regulator
MSRTRGTQIAVSHLKSHIGFWMRLVSNQVSHAFARKLEQSGVTVAEWVAMREMFGESQTAPSTVAQRIGMTRGAITKLIDRLLARGLVTRRESWGDRRYQEIALTAAGRRLVPVLAALADRNDEEFFHPLSARERETLLGLLKKLAQTHGLEKLPTE